MRRLFLFSFSYTLFTSILLLAKALLTETDIRPFYAYWYAEEDKSLFEIYDNRRKEKLQEHFESRKDLEPIGIPESEQEENSLWYLKEINPVQELYRDQEITEIERAFSTSESRDTPGFKHTSKDFSFKVFGHSGLKSSFGFANYLTAKDAKDDFSAPNSSKIRKDFFLAGNIGINVKGKAGKRILIDIDYDQNEQLTDNMLKIKYFALREKEFIQEVTVGNVDFDLPESNAKKFNKPEKEKKKSLGVESKFGSGKLKFHGLAVLTRGESETEIFNGRTRNFEEVIPEYRFLSQRYFQLEPFLRYDSLSSPPTISANSYDRNSVDRLITLTSVPAGNINEFQPNAVNIDASSLEVWLDDRDPRNDQVLNAKSKIISGNSLGIFHKLKESEDYSFNSVSGRLAFIISFASDAKIYVRYTRSGSGSNTSDPSARTNIDGKIETFIYFENNLNEDTNYDGSQDVSTISDGKINFDIYEIRGVYDLNVQNIKESRLQLNIVDRNRSIIPGFYDVLGAYDLDSTNGLIFFTLREPFKAVKNPSGEYILDNSAAWSIYTEEQINVIESSLLAIQANIEQEVQSYKLKHSHILANSMTVKVDGQMVDPTLYVVDHQLGFFHFVNNGNPVILDNTRIEISYEYSPFDQLSKGFILGLRTTYDVSKDIQLGNTVYYNGQFEQNNAPKIGEEPVSRLVIQNDLTMDLKEDRFTQIINSIPGFDFDLLPVQYKFYGEHSRNFYNPNTTGRALVDDMESSEEKIDVSTSDRDWQISSLPSSLGLNECERAPLYYKYYRDLDNIRSGPLPFFAGARAEPAYSELAGPYNVSEGHLDTEQLLQSERQSSLVLDFDFSGGAKVASIVTRRFSNRSGGEDLSKVEYIEFSAKLIDPLQLADGVSVRFDIGSVNEDSDNDKTLDTEDVGLDGINNDINGDGIPDSGTSFSDGEHNYKLDSVIGGYNEDIGYRFNVSSSCVSLNTKVGAGPAIADVPRTIGNGVLNTEDLNGDGRLESTENVVILDELNRPYLRFDTSGSLNSSNRIHFSDWSLVRMYIDLSVFSEQQLQALKNVKSVRLYIVPGGEGSASGKGKLLIDNIKFGSSKWREKRVNMSGTEIELNDPAIFSVSVIDNQDSKSEYKAQSFIELKKNEYEEIHGKKSNTERARIREAALKLSYDFTSSFCSGRCQYVYVRRVFLRSINLDYYKKINIWVNYRELNASEDKIFIRLGSSDRDYIEMSQQMSRSGWQLLSFDIPEVDSSELCASSDNFSGCPNLSQINTVSLGIQNGNIASGKKGIIWVNDIFVSESRIQSDDSYTIRNYVNIIKPLYKTEAGVPVFDRLEISYEKKYSGKRFFAIGESFANIGANEDNIDISSKILPYWDARYYFSRVRNESDPKSLHESRDFDGDVTRLKHSTQHGFQFQDSYLPKVVSKYEYDKRTIKKKELVSLTFDAQKREEKVEEKSYNPSLIVKEVFPPFLNQEFILDLELGVQYFKRDQYIDYTEGKVLTDQKEYKLEKQQTDRIKTGLSYKWRNFSLRPFYSFSQLVLVNQNFSNNQNIDHLNGDYYFPLLITSNDFRYIQRESFYQIESRYEKLWGLTPGLKYSFKYNENFFRDHEDNLLREEDRYQRLKQPNSLANTYLNFDFDLTEISEKLTFLKSFTTSFFREVSLIESSVPFSKKTPLLKDDFGLSSRFRTLGARAFNIFRYPIWYHFTSKGRHRNNFSRGREYIQFINFRPQPPSMEFENIFANYTQSIALKEKMSASMSFVPLDWVYIVTETHLGQSSERSGDIGSLPVQAINWGVSLKQSFNLMEGLNFWFWTSNDEDEKAYFTRKNSRLELNFRYEKNMRITDNISRGHYIPEFGLSFGWFDSDNASHLLRLGSYIDFISENKSEFFIDNDHPDDQNIYENILDRAQGFKKNDIGFGFSILYSLELPGLRKWFQHLARTVLSRNPEYRIELSTEFKRYDYEIYTSLADPTFDIYALDQTLNMNLHKNITGEIYLKSALEIERDQQTNEQVQKIIAFESGLSVQVIF